MTNHHNDDEGCVIQVLKSIIIHSVEIQTCRNWEIISQLMVYLLERKDYAASIFIDTVVSERYKLNQDL